MNPNVPKPVPNADSATALSTAREAVVELGKDEIGAQMFVERTLLSLTAAIVLDFAYYKIFRHARSPMSLFERPLLGVTITILLIAGTVLPFGLIRLRRIRRALAEAERDRERLTAKSST